MNHSISPLVSVDHAACERLASAIRSMDIPEDREESPPATLTPARLGDFYLFLVAICHQTQTLWGAVRGRDLRGWDYLHGRLSEAVERDPGLLAVSRWREIGAEEIASLFADPAVGRTLTDPGGRAALIRDLGTAMESFGWPSFDDLLEAAGRRIATGSPNLLELLARFRAYGDPVRKKSMFLLGLIRNEARIEFADPGELLPRSTITRSAVTFGSGPSWSSTRGSGKSSSTVRRSPQVKTSPSGRPFSRRYVTSRGNQDCRIR